MMPDDGDFDANGDNDGSYLVAGEKSSRRGVRWIVVDLGAGALNVSSRYLACMCGGN